MKFFLGGVNGAGKTTLLQKIKEARPEYEVIKGSQTFMEYLGIPGDYDALRAMPEPEALQKLEEMLDGLLAKHKNFIFDAHYLNLVRGKVKSVTSSYLNKFDALLLLKVSPETVLERTSKETRDRALFPEGLKDYEQFDMLRDYIDQYDQEFEHLCRSYDMPGKVLNGEGSPGQVLQEFLDFESGLK